MAGKQIAIGALGTGDYETIRYHKSHPRDAFDATELAQEAVVHHYQIDEYRVLVTPQVENNERQPHFTHLRERLGDKLKPTSIPEEQTNDDLWAIFQKVVDTAPHKGSKDEVTLDVTHAFRSFPMIILAAAVFLRQARGTKIKRIVYGMATGWPDEKGEAPPHTTGKRKRFLNDEAPLVEVTPFLDLMDWTRAVSLLTECGRGDFFCQMTRKTNPSLEPLGEAVRKLCLSLQLTRAAHATHEACTVLGLIEKAKDDPEKLGPSATPLLMLLGSIEAAFQPIAAPQPFDLTGMRAQANMVRWYMERKLYMQAIGMMREWIVSHVCLLSGLDPTNPANRNINGDHPLLGRAGLPADQVRVMGPVWEKVRPVRNDVLHSEFIHDAQAVQVEITKCFAGFKQMVGRLFPTEVAPTLTKTT